MQDEAPAILEAWQCLQGDFADIRVMIEHGFSMTSARLSSLELSLFELELEKSETLLKLARCRDAELTEPQLSEVL